ncbi:MAG TPA: hypothetical protein VF211_14840 [Burkholderiales bacterium]
MLGAALLAAALLAASPPPAGAQARGFDCSRASDPQGCEQRVARMREARDKARQTCAGKSGGARRDCMAKAFCADAPDPAKCEATLEERVKRRREAREKRKADK